MTDADRIVELRDMLAALHFECLGFARKEGGAFDRAMSRVEREFGKDPTFQRRFG